MIIDFIILLITYVLFCIIVIGEHKNSEIWRALRIFSLILLTSAFMIACLTVNSLRNEPVIIQNKGNGWELSDDKTIKSDTCITRIVIENKTDTIYPTTCYKVLKQSN